MDVEGIFVTIKKRSISINIFSYFLINISETKNILEQINIAVEINNAEQIKYF